MKYGLIMTLLLLPALCMAQPSIGKDGRVTLHYASDTAREVSVKGGDGVKGAMKRKGDDWTLTTGMLPSDMYTYRFTTDGGEHTFTDPANSFTVRDIADTLSAFIIPGYPGSYYMDNNSVEHGTIQKMWYPSTLNGMAQRRLSVYLPPRYSRNAAEPYPVLYLLHGSGGDEDAWPAMGRLQQIMDNMIAEGQCRPMVVVMPNGNVELDAAPGESPYMQAAPEANNMRSMMGDFEESFVREVVAFAEKNFRIRSDKAGRAIAGLSLGGLHALYISANNPDMFDYVGLFSPQTTNALGDKSIRGMRGITGAIGDLATGLPFVSQQWKEKVSRKMGTTDHLDIYSDTDGKLAAQFATPPKVYYIAVGTNDFVKKLVDRHCKRLDTMGCKYTYNETAGNHSWRSWRRYLIDFLRRVSSVRSEELGVRSCDAYGAEDSFPPAEPMGRRIPFLRHCCAAMRNETVETASFKDFSATGEQGMDRLKPDLPVPNNQTTRQPNNQYETGNTHTA